MGKTKTRKEKLYEMCPILELILEPPCAVGIPVVMALVSQSITAYVFGLGKLAEVYILCLVIWLVPVFACFLGRRFTARRASAGPSGTGPEAPDTGGTKPRRKHREMSKSHADCHDGPLPSGDGEVKPEGDAILSVRGMDSSLLQKALKDAAGSCGPCSVKILECAGQLETMDTYRKKLDNLLDNNGIRTLDDTRDILDKAEQSMCRSVRKVLNYLGVADGSPADMQLVIRQAEECLGDCRALLSQVKGLLFALADFLNSQGGEENTAETVEMYKNCILDSLREKGNRKEGAPALRGEENKAEEV